MRQNFHETKLQVRWLLLLLVKHNVKHNHIRAASSNGRQAQDTTSSGTVRLKVEQAIYF